MVVGYLWVIHQQGLVRTSGAMTEKHTTNCGRTEEVHLSHQKELITFEINIDEQRLRI